MRRVRYSVAMSLDGYIAGPNGEHDWIVMDPEIGAGFAEYYKQFDTFLIGRKTFATVAKPGKKVGGMFAGFKTVVFSRTLNPRDYPNVTIVSDDVKTTVEALKRADGQRHLAVRRRRAFPKPARSGAGGHDRGGRDPCRAGRRHPAAAAAGLARAADARRIIARIRRRAPCRSNTRSSGPASRGAGRTSRARAGAGRRANSVGPARKREP